MLVSLMNVGIAVIALYNWRMGRGNVRGALVIGSYVFGTLALLQLMLSPDITEAVLRRPLIMMSLGEGAYAAAIYLALEPWVRRRWPRAIITWSRVLAARWRDPLVGRDVLIGVVAASAILCVGRVAALAVILAGGAPQGAISVLEPSGLGFALENLTGGRLMIAILIAALFRGLVMALTFFFVLFLFRTLFRPWLGTTAFVIALALFSVVESARVESWTASTGVFMFVLYVAVYLPLALRYGVFAVAVVYCVSAYANSALLTTHFTSWYGQSSFVAILAVTAIALSAFRVSLGRAPLVRANAFTV
jgi:eukaryotic-like serine/threonine-protein kinase